MRDEPLVKVVLTTYNRRAWTRIAVDSILAQTHSNLHIVAVDDASDDGTVELLRAYERDNQQRFTVVAKTENRGPADSVRIGFETGPAAPYVAVVNDDDSWLPQKLERQLGLFMAEPELGLVFCDAEIVDAAGNLTGECFSDLYGRFGTGDASDVFRDNRCCASTHLMRAEIAALVARTMPNPSLVTDYYIVMAAAGVARIGSVAEPLARYRLSPGSVQTREKQMRREAMLARERAVVQVPGFADRLGGRRMARRVVALRDLEIAIARLDAREYSDSLWYSCRVVRHRQLRPIVWLGIHSIRSMIGRLISIAER